MMISKAVRVAALLMGGTALLAGAPAVAQNSQAQAAPERKYNLSRPEQQALAPLIQASTAAQAQGQAANWGAVEALLPAAQAAAKGNDARYLVARVQLAIALGRNNLAGQEAAVAALLSNPATTPQEQATYRQGQMALVNKRAEQAVAANDFATAERLYRQLQQANPGDQRIATNLRIVQERMGNTSGALQGLQQQIQQAEVGGQRAPEALYQRAWQIPYRAGQRSEAVAGLGRLLRAYPTAANWRTAVDMVREKSANDTQFLLDIFRFARTANVIQPNEYTSLAATLDQAGLPGEVKATLDAGIAARAVQSSQADVARLLGVTNRRIAEDRAGLPAQIAAARRAVNGREARIAGDVLYGYGRYQEASELYRLALTKGGEDANLVNTRLGASLAMAGQRAHAETALRAVTGNRAELASLWMTWLARTPA